MTGVQQNPVTTVDFDVDPGGSFITDGQPVYALYWSKVTFSCAGCSSANDVYARYPGRTANGVSIKSRIQANYTEPGFSAYMGVVQAKFVRPASCVTIDAFATAPGSPDPFLPLQGAPWLEADDVNDNPVGHASYQGALGQWQTLTICTGSYDIASVRFSSSDAAAGKNGVLGRFDNFTFEQAPVSKPPPILPPPRIP
jgi:hypothetical protein